MAGSTNEIPGKSELQQDECECGTATDVTDGFDRSLRPGSLTFIHKTYNMNHPRRGRVIIFNHYRFLRGNGIRQGTDSDVKNLRGALLQLGFSEKDIHIYEDLCASEISGILRKVQKKDHTDCDMLMIFVLTHGLQNDKILAYDVEYPIENLWEPFRADACKTLAGKPKVFFVVACRGQNVDGGLKIETQESITEVDAKPIEHKNSYSIPVWSDFLCVFSTYKGYYSYRNVEFGTWYIQAFCEELSNTDIHKISFVDFLTAVNGRLSRSFELETPSKTVKQISTFSSTLTKRIYFTKETEV